MAEERAQRTSAFKQIGSLFAEHTIGGHRMICLTKYVTVTGYQRENRTFMMVSGWLASPQFAARPSVVARLCTPASALAVAARTETDTTAAAFRAMHQLQN